MMVRFSLTGCFVIFLIWTLDNYASVCQNAELWEVEHILPIEVPEESDWASMGWSDKDAHQSWVGRLGNLHVLTGEQNKEVSNAGSSQFYF